MVPARLLSARARTLESRRIAFSPMKVRRRACEFFGIQSPLARRFYGQNDRIRINYAVTAGNATVLEHPLRARGWLGVCVRACARVCV